MSSSFLACPCERKQDLIEVDQGHCCSGNDCAHSKPENKFGNQGTTPILIAFDLTDTVCAPEAYQTKSFYVPREAGRFMNLARHIVYGVSKVTTSNCQSFLSMIKAGSARPRVLIIGSGARGSGTEALYADTTIERTGIDIYQTPFVDYIADAHYLPFRDGSFDGIWIQAVLEHVVDPVKVVAEIHRLLTPNGVIYAETPFMQQVHEGAYDYTRYSVLAHRYLFKNFAMDKVGGNGGPGVVLAWSIKYLIWGVLRSRKVAAVLSLPFYFAGRFIDIFVSQKAMWDSGSGVFFLGRRSTTAIKMADLPKLYEGFMR